MTKFINTLYLGYIILWPLIYNFILPVDGAGRIYMLLTVVALMMNIPNVRFRKLFFNPVILLWFIWIIYSSLNFIRIGIKPQGGISFFTFFVIYLILPWMSMWITTYEARVRPRYILNTLLIYFSIYVFCGFIFQIGGGSANERGGAILGNMLPLISLCLLFLSCIAYNLKSIKVYSLISVIILTTATIFMVATRKAFLGEIIILLAFAISRVPRITFKSLSKLILVCLIAYFIFSVFLENSVLGERFTNIENDAERYNTTDSFLLSLLGDRAYFYITGWELFLTKPLFGIGLNNYMSVTHYPMPIHSEYMVQLTENGLIGFLIYVIFMISFSKKCFKSKVKPLKRLYVGWLLCIIFLSFTTWTYDMPQYFMLFGIITAYVANEHKYEMNQ